MPHPKWHTWPVASSLNTHHACRLPTRFSFHSQLMSCSQVWGGSQLGNVLSLEPAPRQPEHQRQRSGGGGRSSRQAQPQAAVNAALNPTQPHHDLAEWGNNSGVFSSVGSKAGENGQVDIFSSNNIAGGIDSGGRSPEISRAGSAALSAAAARAGFSGDAAGGQAGSPTADKENQGGGGGAAGGSRKQQPGAVDWEDFLSGASVPETPYPVNQCQGRGGDDERGFGCVLCTGNVPSLFESVRDSMRRTGTCLVSNLLTFGVAERSFASCLQAAGRCCSRRPPARARPALAAMAG